MIKLRILTLVEIVCVSMGVLGMETSIEFRNDNSAYRRLFELSDNMPNRRVQTNYLAVGINDFYKDIMKSMMALHQIGNLYSTESLLQIENMYNNITQIHDVLIYFVYNITIGSVDANNIDIECIDLLWKDILNLQDQLTKSIMESLYVANGADTETLCLQDLSSNTESSCLESENFEILDMDSLVNKYKYTIGVECFIISSMLEQGHKIQQIQRAYGVYGNFCSQAVFDDWWLVNQSTLEQVVSPRLKCDRITLLEKDDWFEHADDIETIQKIHVNTLKIQDMIRQEIMNRRLSNISIDDVVESTSKQNVSYYKVIDCENLSIEQIISKIEKYQHLLIEYRENLMENERWFEFALDTWCTSGNIRFQDAIDITNICKYRFEHPNMTYRAIGKMIHKSNGFVSDCANAYRRLPNNYLINISNKNKQQLISYWNDQHKSRKEISRLLGGESISNEQLTMLKDKQKKINYSIKRGDD